MDEMKAMPTAILYSGLPSIPKSMVFYLIYMKALLHTYFSTAGGTKAIKKCVITTAARLTRYLVITAYFILCLTWYERSLR